MRTTYRWRSVYVLASACVGVCPPAPARPAAAGDAPEAEGWTSAAPRDEIRPEFAVEPGAGPGRLTALAIKAGGRDGVDGYWTKTFPVRGGNHYHFDARFQAKGVDAPRRSVV